MQSTLGANRREWLRGTTIGVLAASLSVEASRAREHDHHSEDAADGDEFLKGPGCPQVLKVSKRLSGPIKLFPCPPCRCECTVEEQTHVIIQTDYRATLRFSSAPPCDETEREPLLQGGVELWLRGRFTLRADQCGEPSQQTLVGRNQGRFHIHRYRPNEGIVDGPFCGTEGVLSTVDGGQRCCVPGQGIGSFCGEGKRTLAGWSLCVSYRSRISGFSPQALCEPTTLDMVMDLDGVLIGPCQPIGQKHQGRDETLKTE